MSSRPQLAPSTDSFLEPIAKTSQIATQSEGAGAVVSPAVLLVGRNGSLGPALLKSLRKYRTQFSLAAPEEATPEFATSGGYRLILLDSTVSAEQRKQLTVALAGSHASLFYAFPVEYDCWWLPVLRNGRNCYGAPAFRRNEFAAELGRVLRDQAQA